MEIKDKLVKINNISNNNLILKKLRNSIKKQDDSINENGEKYNKEIINKELKHCNYNNSNNELFKFKLSLSKYSQEYAKLNKENARYKFLLTSYSHILITLLKLKYDCGLEDLKEQLVKLRQLNHIFVSCKHFSSLLVNRKKTTDKNKSSIICIENENNVNIKNEKTIIKEKIVNLNTSMDYLRKSMKSYLMSSIKGDYADSNINISIKVINNTNLCYTKNDNSSENFSDDSVRDQSDNCISESINLKENDDSKIELIRSKKAKSSDRGRLKRQNKMALQHRRHRETISYGGTNILINSPIDYSPAPKYHSRSKTLSTKDDNCVNIVYIDELVCDSREAGAAYYGHNMNIIGNKQIR
ncbi:hypothetical protein FG379_000084 [Cryptosporidium bovis]|uniref:uncharacterized protein n=1 Tax=Cryptosporidium bovis TaxID=310047 RepID=UPI00351A2ADF|nr:hypothetical protein FG379_000084 [Cryptosporidium bovis]